MHRRRDGWRLGAALTGPPARSTNAAGERVEQCARVVDRQHDAIDLSLAAVKPSSRHAPVETQHQAPVAGDHGVEQTLTILDVAGLSLDSGNPWDRHAGPPSTCCADDQLAVFEHNRTQPSRVQVHEEEHQAMQTEAEQDPGQPIRGSASQCKTAVPTTIRKAKWASAAP